MAHHVADRGSNIVSVSATVENVGGIEHAEVSLSPGVTVLRGRNATNRTSFLSAVDSALGGPNGSLKSDAAEGSVELSIDGERYVRTFHRESDGFRVGGEPYVSDPSLVETFVSLLESNPARRAVERGDDLREIIMRPINTEEINARIEELQAEKERLADRIDRVGERKDELPDLEQRRQSLQSEIDAVDEEIEALRSELDEYEGDQGTAAAADSLVDELDEARQKYNRLQQEIEVTEAEIESLESELSELPSIDDDPEYTDGDLSQVKEDLAVARERRRQVQETIDALFTIIEFNQDLIDGSLELPGIEPDDVDPTSELAPDEQRELICWTCGSAVTRRDVDARLDVLRDVIEDKRTERVDIESQLETLQEEHETIEDVLDERERVREERSQIRDQLADKRERLSTLQSRRADLAERIGALESEVAESQQLRDDDLLDMYEQLSDHQYERGQLTQQLDDVRAEIEEIRQLPELADLRADLEGLREQIADQRSRIDRLEQRAVETFNRHMDELLDILEYDNITRVWIERHTPEDRSDADATFRLHVIRDRADGTGYEEAIDNLSESERELIGLVFALAGYLTHEVCETVPFILVDSLEAIDSERIAKLVDHFSEHAAVLLVALLPEDARAVDDRHDRVSADELR